MTENEDKDFNKNLQEIRKLSENLKEPLKEPVSILYYDEEKKRIKYKGEMMNNKYEGRGILYNDYGDIIYNGYFSNNDYDGFGNEFKNKKLVYEGFFNNGKKNGKGSLYYNNKNQIYFTGIFNISKFNEGITYSPDGEKIYEGLFINNRPKEGKNLKLFDLDGELEYEGDFSDGHYQGKGTLYEKGRYESEGVYSKYKNLKYIGEFENDHYEGQGKLYIDHYLGKYLFYEGSFHYNSISGYGKIYFQNGEIFYDGQVKSNYIDGKGTKYYKNGNIKIEGIFSKNICIEGTYYDPKGLKLYVGEFKNDIPKESKNIILYDNNMNKIYEGEIHDARYEGTGIEYCSLKKDKVIFKGNFKNNSYIIPNFEMKELKDKYYRKSFKIVLLSHGDIPGKTCLVNRMLIPNFDISSTLATIGTEKYEILFENNNNKYKMIMWDTAGAERFMSVSLNTTRYANMVIYLFDISRNNVLDQSLIDRIKETNKNIMIYIVGNKIDLLKKDEDIEFVNGEYFAKFRNIAADVMNKNLVEKYFEISVKTGEGMDKLLTSLKLEALKFIQENPIVKETKEKKKKDKCIII